MTQFQRKPLGVLDGIYGFQGGIKGVNRLDLSSDITIVHDVSRQAEKAGFGNQTFGYVRWRENITTAGAASSGARCTAAQIETALGLNPQTYDWWILNIGGYCSDGDISDIDTLVGAVEGPAAHLGDFQDVGSGTSLPMFGVFYDSVVHRVLRPSSGSTYYGVLMFESLYNALPIRMPSGAAFSLTLKTSAAATFYALAHFWVGARGATPPGVG